MFSAIPNPMTRRPTGKHIADLLPAFMEGLRHTAGTGIQEVLKAWPEIIGERLAPHARALFFAEGTLTVSVSNSALYSLLVSHEKRRLLKLLQARFPRVGVRDLKFQRSS
jgi:predicted nucleic acid-binding Zn ribbon protein